MAINPKHTSPRGRLGIRAARHVVWLALVLLTALVAGAARAQAWQIPETV